MISEKADEDIEEEVMTPEKEKKLGEGELEFDKSIRTELKEKEESVKNEVRKACLCYPDQKLRTFWILITSLALIIACFMTPFGLAFDWLDARNNHRIQFFFFNDAWNSIDSIIDIIFMLEIIICFNTSYYYDNDDHK